MSDFLSPPAQRSGVVRGSLTRVLRVLAMGVGAVLLAAALVAPAVPAEAANPSNGFQPGNIVSDANFYDGNAMSVAEVQSFLNKQVPSCWLGRPGYEVGKPVSWNGPTKLASKCLRDFRINTSTELANPYCAAIPGQKNESAASVIVRVGKACGISPKVLLVMLDKEQSLVSDPWPNENQYFYAMGYACPDSGPGGTANCDASRGGFAKQVYRAAWQLKVYRAFPNTYRYRPFQANTIQWHPNTGCGTSQVRIEGYATAALYIYTPYRPNQAALNAGWGTGDACSTYGNRNFYNYYNAWFGSPVIDVANEFKALHSLAGGVNGSFGSPAGAVQRLTGGELRQKFSGGTMYWSRATGAGGVRGGMETAFNKAGGVTGRYGLPRGLEQKLEGGGYEQEFARGIGTWRSDVGFGYTKGAIGTLYRAQRGTQSPLGYAIGEERAIKGGGYEHGFTGGTAYWHKASGASFVKGAFRASYLASGGPTGPRGFPRGMERISAAGSYTQDFLGGTAFWSAKTGATFVKGAIRTAYLKAGGTASPYGLPVGDELMWRSGVYVQRFANGFMSWSSGTGAVVVKGGIFRAYEDLGGIDGFLGQPLGSESSQRGGAFAQDFRGGSLIWTAATGAVPVKGAIRTLYIEERQSDDYLGAPLAAESAFLNGYRQDFTRGAIVWTARSGAIQLRGAIGSAYLHSRNFQEQLGAPVARERFVNGRYEQQFERGLLRWTSASGVTAVPTQRLAATPSAPVEQTQDDEILEDELHDSLEEVFDEESQLEGESVAGVSSPEDGDISQKDQELP